MTEAEYKDMPEFPHKDLNIIIQNPALFLDHINYLCEKIFRICISMSQLNERLIKIEEKLNGKCEHIWEAYTPPRQPLFSSVIPRCTKCGFMSEHITKV